MGTDKALLEIGGRPLIERIVRKLSLIGQEVIVVTNSPKNYAFLGVRLVGDVFPGRGSLVGLYSGLKAARSDYSLVVACDMPFLNLDLLRYLAALAPYHDVVIPWLKKGLEPLHAVYSKACLGPIEALLRRNERKILEFFPQMRVRYVEEEVVRFFDPQLRSFVNINTPTELAWVRSIFSSKEVK